MYYKLRYFFRLIIAYVSRFKAIIFLSVFLGVLSFPIILFLRQHTAKPDTQRIGIYGRFYSDTLPTSILDLLSEGLTTIDETGVVTPGIAESWETPDKGQTWEFKIKRGLSWHDGTPITSDTIQYDFSDVGIERPDPQTIIFKLQQPFSPFPSIVARPVFKKGLLGMKEWRVKNISVTGSYIQTLELVNQENATKTYRFYPTIERTKLAFKLGEVDMIADLYDPKPFDAWKIASVTKKTDENQIITLFFNTQDSLLSEKSVRQAFSYALNKDSYGPRAISSIPEYSWSFNPQVKRYDYDPKRAKELIESLPDELKQKLSVKLSTNPLLLSTAEKIANDWRAVGIATSVQISSVTPTDYQAFLTIYDVPRDPDQYAFWHSTQTTTNISHYVSPRIDKLLEDGRTIIDLEERRKVYLDFQRFLLEDVPAIFLYHPEYYTVTRR